MQKKIVFDWISGQRLVVERGMTGATGNVYMGLHECADMLFLLHMLRPDDLFLDIGANIGSYTILASGVCGASTLAFEPDPLTAGRLRENVDANGLKARVVIHDCALGPTRGSIAFTVGRDTVNRVASSGETDIRSVRQERLDDLLGDREPCMMKLDVEGYEQEVLAGAAAALARPSLVAIEIETVNAKIDEFLRSHSFARSYYDPFTRALHCRPIENGASNALYVRDRAFVEARLASAKPVEILGRRI